MILSLWLLLQEAPALEPRLLCVARVGGRGDQAFQQVLVKGSKVYAASAGGFKASVELLPDGTVRGKAWGDVNAAQSPAQALPHVASARLGEVEYGFKQVAPLLQQPFMKGPGWTLWGWSEAQAKGAKARYAPFMADSGIRLALKMPNKNLFAVGICDGGNTSLRAHPKDIDRSLDFPVATGGGAGRSSFVFEISPRGELLRQMALRGSVNAAAWDTWGRALLVGRGVVAGNDAEAHAAFGYGDGAGLLIVDAEWTRPLFKASLGPASLWAVDVDPESGIGAAAGWVEGDIQELHPIQARPGEGKDALLVVFRLWPSK